MPWTATPQRAQRRRIVPGALDPVLVVTDGDRRLLALCHDFAMTVLSSHIRQHRGALAVTYCAVVIENTFELLYPFAIGLAVDDLLDDAYRGLLVFVAVSLAHTAVAIARQWYDARSFNHLYADMASALVAEQRVQGVATTSVVARTALVAEYVDFLQVAVVAAITAAFAVVGSLIMLFVYDPQLGAVAAAVAIPVAVLNRRLVRRSSRIFRPLNDESELEVSTIDNGSPDEVRHHFKVIARHWIRLSDVEATSWGVVDLIGLGLSVFALVHVTRNAGEVGTIFAVIAYVWAYLGGFDQVPSVLQRVSNLGDIRRRLDAAAAGDDAEPTSPQD